MIYLILIDLLGQQEHILIDVTCVTKFKIRDSISTYHILYIYIYKKIYKTKIKKFNDRMGYRVSLQKLITKIIYGIENMENSKFKTLECVIIILDIKLKIKNFIYFKFINIFDRF